MKIVVCLVLLALAIIAALLGFHSAVKKEEGDKCMAEYMAIAFCCLGAVIWIGC